MQRSSVVLPDPLGPMTHTTSPVLTSRSTPRNTWSVPKYFSTCEICDHTWSDGAPGVWIITVYAKSFRPQFYDARPIRILWATRGTETRDITKQQTK